jgi:hypothetical protein
MSMTSKDREEISKSLQMANETLIFSLRNFPFSKKYHKEEPQQTEDEPVGNETWQMAMDF